MPAEVSTPHEHLNIQSDRPFFGLLMLTMSSVFLRQLRQRPTFSWSCPTEFAFGCVNGLRSKSKTAGCTEPPVDSGLVNFIRVPRWLRGMVNDRLTDVKYLSVRE
jgi:hypothetical protein